MNELIKRIITSVILIIILIFSFYNNAILILSLLLIFFQIYYEFLLIFRKIFHNRNKLILYSILFCILICLSILIFKIWLIIDSENSAEKIFLLFIISISICSDIGGYTFGKLFKGKKISKRGHGLFKKTHDDLILTDLSQKYRSRWKFPTKYFANSNNLFLNRMKWENKEESTTRYRGFGQEFILDVEKNPKVIDWAENLILKHG